MATFSLGTSGVTPGAPGVYINEQAGRAANADIADFSTVYMLVETDETVPVTQFPFNTPIAISSLEDYKALTRVGNTSIPEARIPLLSYNCVNEFFQNAQIGDLRVVRVGTPDQIVEIEFFPSATKISTTGLPSALMAGDKAYIQLLINGQKLVAGDGSTGYTADGEWLGVPVTIPVTYVAGDEANNRLISASISLAVAEAIESNPSINSSVYVRQSGLVNDLNPAANSQNSFVTIAATTFNAEVSVLTQALPVGSNPVLMQNGYDIENIVGGAVTLVRVPDDYTQCIQTSFDGQQDQGYLITPTAYAQFDAKGRAEVGAAAAAHCASNNYKWMALADAGPFLVTDINEYSEFVPHKAAEDFVEGGRYLVDNAIYKWIGNDVTYNRLTNQSIVFGESAATAVNESANLVADGVKVGVLDAGKYTVNAIPDATKGVFELSNDQYWPVTLPIQQVTLTGAGVGNDFTNVDIQGGASGLNLSGTEVYVIAPPKNLSVDGEYSYNQVLLATTAGDASTIYNAVVLAGGTDFLVTAPNGAVVIAAPTGDTALLTYADSYWDLPQEINGQTSDLIQNISGSVVGVNTLHLPSTLQDPTTTYILNWVSRTFLNPSTQISSSSGVVGVPDGSTLFTCLSHGLRTGQRVFFTRPVTATVSGTTSTIVSSTAKLGSVPYWVKVVSGNTFVLSNSLANFSTSNFIALPNGTVPATDISKTPSILYTQVLARGTNDINPVELLTVPVIRARKYAFDSNSIWSQALDSSVAPTGVEVAGNPFSSIFLGNSSVILGEDQVSSYGEDLSSTSKCDLLSKLNLVAPDPTPVTAVTNAFCVPTVDQYFQSESYMVPSIDPILLGNWDGSAPGTVGPVLTVAAPAGTTVIALSNGTYTVAGTGVDGTGLSLSVTVTAGALTAATVLAGGSGFAVGEAITLPAAYGDWVTSVATVDASTLGSIATVNTPGYVDGLATLGVKVGSGSPQLQLNLKDLLGCFFNVTVTGVAPDGQAVVVGDRIAVIASGNSYAWVVVKADALGGDLTSAGQPCYGSQVELVYTPEQGVPKNLWRFDAITPTELINDALRGAGFNGVAQAEFVEAGVDTVNRLLDDSQRYFNPFGFIAFYGPYIENGAGQFIPPSPYVTGVALRRYRAEGYQFPPAGVKYQLADALGVQLPVNSSQQNLLNPKGCNVVRTLPGYPQTAVFIWGGRTRVNEKDAQQRLYQFVNTRVILNVVYGSLLNAFDSQIFNVIDGFGVVFNQIISIGNSVLNQLYVRGALFGSKPRDAFQVICDDRINLPEDLENGVVNAKVFVTPVPTLERIQIDLIRVAVGKMQQELDIQGLGGQ